jgi:RNase adaptor protein for sRNA GlmZ degradation
MSNNTKIKLNIGSFSYRKGYPVDSSEHGGGFIFDCRFINNPGRIDEYKSLTGKDNSVKKYLEDMNETENYFAHIVTIITAAINKYLERKFDYLSVQFGCTGGQHRSVYFAEKLAEFFAKNQNLEVSINHRDCPK